MINKLLDTYRAFPLEREYEAWIINGIEEYFLSINLAYDIWAINPKLEKTWPSDEVLEFDGKLVGLQFKRPKLFKAKITQSTVTYDRLKWSLNSPKGQFAKVVNHSEIFFCLPTFINRKFRSVSLSHCLFWHPTKNSKPFEFWYANNNKKNQSLATSPDVMRWGHFIEQILDCKIGKKFEAGESISDYVESLSKDFQDIKEIEENVDLDDISEPNDTKEIKFLDKSTLYLLYLKFSPSYYSKSPQKLTYLA